MSKQTTKTIIIVALCAWLGSISTIWAGGHDTPPPFDPSILDAELTSQINEVVMGMAERWNSQDYKTVLEVWDKDVEVPVYLAEEQSGWFVGWEALNNYLNPARPSDVIDVMRFQIYDVRAIRLADDLAIGVWEYQFDMKMALGKPYGKRVRGSGIFRKKPEGWRFIYYAESPKSPFVSIEEAFQNQLSDDWDEFYKGAKE